MFKSDETEISYVTSDLLDIFVELTGIADLDNERIDKFYDDVFNKIDSSDDDIQVFLNEFIMNPDAKF